MLQRLRWIHRWHIYFMGTCSTLTPGGKMLQMNTRIRSWAWWTWHWMMGTIHFPLGHCLSWPMPPDTLMPCGDMLMLWELSSNIGSMITTSRKSHGLTRGRWCVNVDAIQMLWGMLILTSHKSHRRTRPSGMLIWTVHKIVDIQETYMVCQFRHHTKVLDVKGIEIETHT